MGDYYSDEKIASRNDSRNRFATFGLHDNSLKPIPKKKFTYNEHNLAANALGDFQDHMKKRKARAESIMINAAETLVKMKKSKSKIGGKAKVYTGPKNGKYIIKNGSKVYIKCK